MHAIANRSTRQRLGGEIGRLAGSASGNQTDHPLRGNRPRRHARRPQTWATKTATNGSAKAGLDELL